MVHIVSFSHLSSKTRKSKAPDKKQVNMKPITKPGDFDLKNKSCNFTREGTQGPFVSSLWQSTTFRAAGHEEKIDCASASTPGPDAPQ